jgi:hypothetical protein
MSKHRFSWSSSRWRDEWPHSLFEYRHYRRLAPLLVILGVLIVVWSFLVLALGLLLGGRHLIWQKSFAQNVIASLLVLPLSLAIGVFVGTLIQKHSLRFQVRHAGDRLGDCVRLATFKFILFLQTGCGIPIDVAGPVDSHLVTRARGAAQRSFVESDWSLALPPDFQLKVEETVDALALCYRGSPDLRMAFPQSFDLMDGLESTIHDIKLGTSHSDPCNTALIILHFAGKMIRDFE